jgi:hypothetical protein
MNNGNDNKNLELSEEDKKFATSIADEFKIPSSKMESYLLDLHNEIMTRLQDNELLRKIDYKGDYSLDEMINVINYSRIILSRINSTWEIIKYRKYIIAARILMHYKLDKYKPIKTKKQNLTGAFYYNRYLYDLMKSRFKKFNRTS